MRKLITICAVFGCALMLAGCNTDKVVEENVKKDMATIEESVKKDVAETEEFSKEKIDEAVTYIQENINELNIPEKAQKVYEYGLYLEEAAKKEGNAIEHDITAYATKAKEYASNALTATENEVEKIADEAKTELSKLGDSINSKKDALIEELHILLNR